MQSKLLPHYAIRTGKHQNCSNICTNKSDMHTIAPLVLALAVLPNELFLLLICYVSNSHAQLCCNCLLDTLYKSAVTLPLQAGTAACRSPMFVCSLATCSKSLRFVVHACQCFTSIQHGLVCAAYLHANNNNNNKMLTTTTTTTTRIITLSSS